MTHATKPLMALTAADIMSEQVVMIPREMSLQGAARMLTRAGVSGAPVVDGNGRCIGVLSTTDFMRWVEKDRAHADARGRGEPICSAWQIPDVIEPTCRVEDFMTRDPVLVAPRTKISVLARMMIDAHIHRVLVVENVTQRPIGIVSSMDILAALAREDAAATPDLIVPPAMAGARN